MFIADDGNNVVRRIDPAGYINTVAGNGTVPYNGDGGPATAAALSAWRVSVDNSGHMYIADGLNNRIRKVSYTPNTGISVLTSDELNVSVFPNPANAFFSISIPGKWQTASITVMDLMGRVCIVTTTQNNIAQPLIINTGNLTAGTYIVKVDIGTFVYRSKVMIAR